MNHKGQSTLCPMPSKAIYLRTNDDTKCTSNTSHDYAKRKSARCYSAWKTRRLRKQNPPTASRLKYLTNNCNTPTNRKGDGISQMISNNFPKIVRKSRNELKEELGLTSNDKRLIIHNIYHQNICAHFKERCLQNDIWINWLDQHKINTAFISETKLTALKIRKLEAKKYLPNYKTRAKPSQKLNKNHNSNGMIHLTHNDDLQHTRGFMTSIDNPYIMKQVNTQIRVVLVGAYVPPFTAMKQYKTEPKRMQIIDSIYRDLTKICQMTRHMNYRFIATADFNSRDREETGDHKDNLMKHKFNAFLRINGLRTINKINHYGICTLFPYNGLGKSIVDHVITDIHPMWMDNTYQISMEIHRIPFWYKPPNEPHKKLAPDHRAITVRITADLHRINKSDNPLNHTLSLYKIKYPKHQVTVKRDPIALAAAAKTFANKLEHDNIFNKMLQKYDTKISMKYIDTNSKMIHINTLYNHFTKCIYQSLADNDCFVRIPNKKINKINNRIDENLQRKIDEYEHLLHDNNLDKNIQIQIENELESATAMIDTREYTEFIDTAIHHKNHDKESLLIRHLKDKIPGDAVIKYKNQILYRTPDIVRNAQNYFHDLYGRKRGPEISGVTDDRINAIINQSYAFDDDHDNRLYDIHELRNAIKHFSVQKATGTDMISYNTIREMSKNNFFIETYLKMINKVHALPISPRQLKEYKLKLLPKVDIVEYYNQLRGIAIMQNTKSIMQYMRWQRIKHIVNRALNKNQTAYREGYSAELLVLSITATIKNLAETHKKVYIAFTDWDKAFNNVCRAQLIVILNEIGINGRNIRSIIDDFEFGIALIEYEGIFSEP